MIRVEHADVLQAIPRLVAEGVICDAVVTDPPYHLTATLARFGKIDINDDTATSIRLRKKADGAARLAHGFMNQQWDGGDIAFRPETWATVSTILRPGAFLVAFGGTRTYHRLACAIEDAGFIIQDCIMWLFATGFPKRRDMLKPAYESIVVARKSGGIAGEIDIIGSHVARLWSQLWSMLPANDAEALSASGLVGPQSGIPGSARESVNEMASPHMRHSLDQMDMSPSGLALITSLSTVSSWHDTLAESSRPAITSTIETELSTTIDWKILRSCLSEITPESIIRGHKTGRLSIADASPAVTYFSAALRRLSATLELSVLAPATSRLPLDCPAEAVSPAYEPAILAYKPGGKRTMQIDECRIEWASEDDKAAAAAAAQRLCHDTPGATYGGIGKTGFTKPRESIAPYLAGMGPGRWPANICHDGSDEVLAVFPNSAGQLAAVRPNSGTGQKTNGILGTFAANSDCNPHGDSGSAARFFFSAKAGPQDRWGSRHPTVKPVELMKWLVALVTPPSVDVLKCVECGYETPYSDMPRVRSDVSANAGSAKRMLDPVQKPDLGKGRADTNRARVRNVRDTVPAKAPREQVLFAGLPCGNATQTTDDLPGLQRAVPEAMEGRAAAEVLFEDMRECDHEDDNCPAVRAVPNSIPPEKGWEQTLLLSPMRGKVERSATAEATTDPARLHINPGTGSSNGEQGRICDAAPAGDGRNAGSPSTTSRSGAPQERKQRRQPPRESGIDEQAAARPRAKAATKNDQVSVLRSGPSHIECCSRCGGRIAWAKRPGLVIDPFAGSGTTGVAALATGRDAILVERENSYIADIRERLAHYEGDGRHSLASKARQAKPRGETPLFEAAQ